MMPGPCTCVNTHVHTHVHRSSKWGRGAEGGAEFLRLDPCVHGGGQGWRVLWDLTSPILFGLMKG